VLCNKSWIDDAALFVNSKDSNYPEIISGFIIVSESRDRVLDIVLIVNGLTRSSHTMTHGSESTILDGNSPYF
jgi:hypothetical protein